MNGTEIKELRKRLGLTQLQMAYKLGVAEFTVRRWESGKSRPSPLSRPPLARLKRQLARLNKK